MLLNKKKSELSANFLKVTWLVSDGVGTGTPISEFQSPDSDYNLLSNVYHPIRIENKC